MENGSKEPSIFRVYLGMVGYLLQILGLLLMPVAVGLGFAIRSNQGLWWMLWFALAGVFLFYGGRAMLRWAQGPGAEESARNASD